MRTYYDLHEYISNSDMGKLDDIDKEDRMSPEQLQDIYDFGNLVDASITERHRVDENSGLLLSENGGDAIQFERKHLQKAELMRQAFNADPSVMAMFSGMRWQHIVLRKRFEIDYQGAKLFIPARCKFDGLNKIRKIGGEIKTTAATTDRQFLDAFYFFNYDRASAWYMDLAGIDRMICVGLSKKKMRNGLPLVFKHAVKRGDECYQSGREKYLRLATKYYFLVHQLIY